MATQCSVVWKHYHLLNVPPKVHLGHFLQFFTIINYTVMSSPVSGIPWWQLATIAGSIGKLLTHGWLSLPPGKGRGKEASTDSKHASSPIVPVLSISFLQTSMASPFPPCPKRKTSPRQNGDGCLGFSPPPGPQPCHSPVWAAGFQRVPAAMVERGQGFECARPGLEMGSGGSLCDQTQRRSPGTAPSWGSANPFPPPPLFLLLAPRTPCPCPCVSSVRMLLPPCCCPWFQTEGIPLARALGTLFHRYSCHCFVVTEPNLGPLAYLTAKPIYWYWVLVKGSAAFIAGHQARRMGSSCSKDQNSPMASREGFLKVTFGVRAAACGLSSDWLVVR